MKITLETAGERRRLTRGYERRLGEEEEDEEDYGDGWGRKGG